ncbi:MAG TPA: hypothetical protein V6C96_00800, partial [Vampirovibrionales bacterium]
TSLEDIGKPDSLPQIKQEGKFFTTQLAPLSALPAKPQAKPQTAPAIHKPSLPKQMDPEKAKLVDKEKPSGPPKPLKNAGKPPIKASTNKPPQSPGKFGAKSKSTIQRNPPQNRAT